MTPPNTPIDLRFRTRPYSSRLRWILLGLVAAIVFDILIAPWLAGVSTDWLWFREVHFESVFVTSFVAHAVLFVVGTLAAFGFLYANLSWARRGWVATAAFVNPGALQAELARLVPKLLTGVALVAAFITGLAVSSQWMTVLTAIHGATVGEADPVFGRDIGFYLFQLPALSGALSAAAVLTVLAIVGVSLVYFADGALSFGAGPRRASIDRGASRHVGALIALLFVVFAAQLWVVDAAGLLGSTTGPFTGASYADVHILLPGLRISAVAAVLTAGFVVYGVVRDELVWFGFLGIVGYAVVGIVSRLLVPAAAQRFVVAPNELTRERPYLERHIAATRRAWRLDSVTTRDLEGDVQLTMADVRDNASTIDNVRLWERDLLKQTFGQLQEIRTYYDFASVSDDRYMVD